MKRELAFALQTQCELTAGLGRTRASKGRAHSGDSNGGVPEDNRSRKRSKGSDGEIATDQNQGKKVSGSQSNGIGVYRRTSMCKDVDTGEGTVIKDKTECSLDLDEGLMKEGLRVGSEKASTAMAVDDEVKNDEDNEAIAINDNVNNVAPRRFTRSALMFKSAVEPVQGSLMGAGGPGMCYLENGENRAGLNAGVNGSYVGSASGSESKKLELKMSKKIALGSRPTTTKGLFSTGLLEGYSVFYNGGNKGSVLRGMIKDTGILCFCRLCKGSRVVNPCQFEIHACQSYRRAAQYICLENGKSLLEVVKACTNCTLDMLEETIRNVIGPLPEKESVSGPLPEKESVIGPLPEKDSVMVPLPVNESVIGPLPEKESVIVPLPVNESVIGPLPEKESVIVPLPENESVIGPLPENESVIVPLPENESVSCQNCKGSFLATFAENAELLCSSCIGFKNLEADRTHTTDTNPRSLQPLLGLRRSTRGAKAIISSEDGNRGKIIKDSSCTSPSVSKSTARVPAPISPKTNNQRKITKKLLKPVSARKSNRSASVRISSQHKSQSNIIQKSSKAILFPRSSKSASVHLSPQEKSKWKITKKDQGLHKLVFEDGGLPDGTEVGYYSRGKKLLEGYKRGPGIFCRCCNSEVSASQFEAHAGWASRKKPYQYIYTSNGVSLHEFAISLLKDRKHAAKDNDDLCIICADGGNLLLCDVCPRAFHIECASLTSIPRGKWYCKYCQNMFQREKFVECNANALAAGRVCGVDPIAQITKRCIRIVRNPDDAEVIACVLCRSYNFRRSGFGPFTVIVCDQCEKEYHVGCLKKHKMADLEELPEGKWFCCVDCRKIYSALQNLLIRGEEKIPDSLLDVIKKKHEDKVSDTPTNFDVRWRVLSGQITSPETRLFLSKAVAIFHDCFDPIVDSATGRDFIPAMVYGRNIRGQDFAGMYCAVLTMNSSVVSAGIFRVFGQEIAELPLVATSNDNQGKGYFQILFSCIEKLLAFLNVKWLVLPAASEAESIWTQKFGFERIPVEQLSNFRRTCWQMLTFTGTTMLQKRVPPCRIIEQHAVDVVEKKDDVDVSMVSSSVQ